MTTRSTGRQKTITAGNEKSLKEEKIDSKKGRLGLLDTVAKPAALAKSEALAARQLMQIPGDWKVEISKSDKHSLRGWIRDGKSHSVEFMLPKGAVKSFFLDNVCVPVSHPKLVNCLLQAVAENTDKKLLFGGRIRADNQNVFVCITVPRDYKYSADGIAINGAHKFILNARLGQIKERIGFVKPRLDYVKSGGNLVPVDFLGITVHVGGGYYTIGAPADKQDARIPAIAVEGVRYPQRFDVKSGRQLKGRSERYPVKYFADPVECLKNIKGEAK